MDASDEMFRQDDEFLEYLMSLPKPQEEQRPLSQAAPADSKTSLEAPSKVGFDHLDNLCKLMEQLGDLKEQNNKLQRRVQYLEDLRALQEMHKQLLAQTQNSQESLLDKKKEDAETLETFEDLDRQHSEELEDGTLPTKAKVSKWTRVKEAFRWEKAQIEPQESRSQDSGIGLCPDRTGHVLQASVESRDISVGAEESVLLCSSQLLSSSSSSNEDLLDIELNFTALSEATNTFIEKSSELRQPSEQLMCRSTSPTDLETERRSKSTDSTHEESGLTKLEKKAGLKTPWSKVKNIIQTRRGSLKRRTVPGFARLSDDELEDEPLWQREHHRFRAEHQHKKLPVLTLTMPSTEEENAENAFAACQPRKEPFQRKISAPRSGSLGVSPPVARRPSKWTKVKKAFLTSRRYDEAPNAISMPSSPQAGGFKFSQHDDIKGARRKSTSGDMERPDRLTDDANHYHLSPQFRKRLLEWQIRRAISGKAAPQEEDDLHRELPEEFARKLEEWKKIKEGKLSPRLSRKDSEKVKVGQKEKQLQWLEKELGKVEREKQRLEREREKFLEREARLERMRRAMYPGEGRDGPEQEVLIQTSTGFFRFHGISEQFTKKLFEWEQQRGIAPEASTFALLDPKYHPEGEAEGGNLIRCKSVGSVAEQTTASSLIVQSQPSSLSLNDVEALEAELEENRMSSEPRLRADSFNRARTDSRSKPRSRSNSKSRPRPPIGRPPIAVQDVPSAVIVDVEATVEVTAPLRSIPCIQPEVPQWSTAEQEKMTLTQEDICTSEGQIHIKRADSVRSSSSHQLLEENMKLLAELKEKEAICRQLELEIEQIERKMHDVSHTQQKQLERLRREERDTDVRYEEPCEDRVQRLRRSVVDLGARRERLQMQTQALQDSFEEASQQQASLAQSLMDHMRLLKQGVEEEAAACPPQFRLDSAYVDPVAKVEALSAQLIILAEKLEKALSSRNQREVPTRTTDLHTSASLGCLSQRSYEQTSSPRRSRVIHQKQSSQELAELPHLLTSKVLELQQGLNKICAASKEAETTTSPERETNTEDEDSESPTATFVVRLNRPQAPPPEEMPSSPQAFWRRVQVQSERSSSTSSSSSEFGKSDGSYSNEVLAALERKSTSQEHPPLDDLSETKPPSGRPDDSSEFEPRTPVRNCSLKRSKNFRTESRETWKQQQFVTSVSPSVTTTEASKLKTRRVSDTHVAYRSQEGPSVIVPTTRKIFSPVQSTNDSIIGYVVSESSSSSSDQRQQDVPPWRRVRDSQSASPALPRKMLCSSPESSPLRPRRLLGDGALPPPFPRSPTPCRKNANGEPKVTSPSIKQMVAKYNQRGNGAEPRASTPVWRSPVLERRDGQVKAQMTKYQDDIKKALQDGFTGARWRKSVQKSASAGAIRSPQNHEPQEPPPLLKSSSAGLIKCPVALTVEPLESQPPSTLTPPPPPRKHFELPKLEIKVESDLPPLKDPPPSPLDESIDQTLKEYRKKPASPQLLGNPRVHRAPCLRALKLKRAREEFLSRGPGSISASLGEPGCRLSQASAGSGSSYEDLLLGGNEGITKSASAGMINVEASTFHRLAAAPSTTLEASKSVSDMKPVRKSSGSLLFGFSSLASKFRKVRLRKKEHQCLSTVSQLCRQSLLVDLNVDKRTLPSTSTRDSSPSNLTNSESKSCPNSPEWMRKNLKR